MITHETLQNIKSLDSENDILIKLMNRYGCDNLQQVSEEDAREFYNREISWQIWLKKLKEKFCKTR